MVGQFIDATDAQFGDRRILNRKDFEAEKKTARHLGGQLCEGELCQEHNGIDRDGTKIHCFELNRKHYGWSYKWVSNKHQSATQHVFVVSAYSTPLPDWQHANLLVRTYVVPVSRHCRGGVCAHISVHCVCVYVCV